MQIQRLSLILVLTTLVFFSCAQPSKKLPASWAKLMADSEIARNPDPALLDFSKVPRWNYTNGLVCLSMQRLAEATKDETYWNYAQKYADEMIGDDGVIQNYKFDEYNIDKVNSGKILFALFDRTKNSKYRKAIELLREQMKTHPRTSEGGFWHKKVYPNQMWLDGLYMGSPFLAQYAKTYNEPALFDDVANQITLVARHTYDSATNLFFHAWDESKQQQWANKQTGKSLHAWGRAMGWYAMALVDVLDYFPKDHKRYAEILTTTDQMAKSIVAAQEKESGLWYQVLDQPRREGNYLESSASTMFTYFLFKAMNNGYIDKNYQSAATKAYEGILKRFIKVENGVTSITDVCAVAGLGGNPYRSGTFEYYISEPKRDNDPKAVGPFIMMCLEQQKLNNR